MELVGDFLFDINLFRKIILISCTLFVGTTISANSVEFVWKKQFVNINKTEHQNNAFDAIIEDIAREVNNYFMPRKVINIDAMIPPLIVKPLLPINVVKPKMGKKVTLKKGTFETMLEFEKRLVAEKDSYNTKSQKIRNKYLRDVAKRNDIITALSNKYKLQVKQRNIKLFELQKMMDDDRSAIEKEQEKKKADIKKYLPIFVKNSFKKYFANPKILDLEYFVDQNIMEVTIGSSVNNFKQVVEINIDPENAQKMYHDTLHIEAKLYYKIDTNANENSIKLESQGIVLNYDGEDYKATVNSTKHLNKEITASIEIDNPTNVSIESQTLDLQTESLTLAYQESKLIPVTYKVTNSKNNEILQRLASINKIKKDDKKWLFVLGIEKYSNEVDSIRYSRQSAESFAKVTQKLLGIPKENSFVLLDNKTTSGQIKSDFRRMLSLVKKGDTIYFYYSGHGIPVAQDNNEPYILAKDIDPSYIDEERFFKLKNIYLKLSESNADKVVAVIDSCFSGSTDGNSVIKGVASSRLVPKKVDSFNKDKMVVLTAGRDKQYSNMYKEKEHRLFSYFIMNALLENDKVISSMYENVYTRVVKESRKMGNIKLQQPTMLGNGKLIF